MTTENLWYRSLEMLKADSRDAEAFVMLVNRDFDRKKYAQRQPRR
jgi:hypothetical protein